MSWQLSLILICTHLAVLGLGCWIGEGSRRARKSSIQRSADAKFRRVMRFK